MRNEWYVMEEAESRKSVSLWKNGREDSFGCCGHDGTGTESVENLPTLLRGLRIPLERAGPGSYAAMGACLRPLGSCGLRAKKTAGEEGKRKKKWELLRRSSSRSRGGGTRSSAASS